MAKSKTEWVVCDAVKQVMRCERCGDTEPLALINGRRVEMAVAILNSFVGMHENCEEKPNA